MRSPIKRILNVSGDSPKAAKVRDALNKNIVGQDDAVNALIEIVEKFHSKLYSNFRPIGVVLLLGPTGSGKTYLCESFSEALLGNPRAMIKIDCAEFQHSHEIAKLVGSPPGYLGHRETPALISQDRLNAMHTADYPLSILLFDEIEKASDALSHLLLGIMDKGTLTLGNCTTVDLSKTIILMTSNVGSAEMQAAMGNGIGFQAAKEIDHEEVADAGKSAARRKFLAEFINRIDRIVPCNALSQEQIERIVSLELEKLQMDIFTKCSPVFYFDTTKRAKQQIAQIGYDPKYNARNVKRVIETEIQLPLAKIISTRAVEPWANLLVDYHKDKFVFCEFKKEKELTSMLKGENGNV